MIQIGNGNWAVKEDNLLGFRYDETEGVYFPREMTFGRACDATRVNPDGLIERVPYNLLQYSEQFDNAYWSTTSATITANSTIAPNGTTTADTFTRTSGTGYVFKGSLALGIGEFTQSVYAKANAVSSIRLEFVTAAFGRGAACIFDLSNGTAGTITIYGGVSGFTASIESVGNGWYRCSLGGTITIADTYFYELSITSGSVYIWGAQLNEGSTAKDYFPTTNRQDIARIDYSSGTGALLLEPQRTNLLLYSQALTTNWTNSGGTFTANNQTGVDGIANSASTFVNTNGNSRYQLFTATAGQAYTFSIYVKADVAHNAQMTAGVIGSLINQTISVTTEWQRFEMTITPAATNCVVGIYASNDGVSRTIYVWGAQLEQGSYATSYIPTTSSSVTRLADTCYKTGVADWIGQTEGTMFAEFEWDGIDKDRMFIALTDGTSSNRMHCGYDETNNRFYFNLRSGNVQQALIVLNSPSVGRYKIAGAYKENDVTFYINGTQIGIDTSTLVAATSQLNVGGYITSGFEYPVNQAVLYKTRLSNSELASLTTI